jgi:hypothetical protein
MHTHEAAALLAQAVPPGPAVWADLGAGGGTFTRALAARLGPGGRIYAVDRDAHAIAALQRWADRAKTDVIAVAALVRPGGRVVIAEYDGRIANRWVPFPLPSARLPALAAAAGLGPPVVTATRPSAFGGTLYVASAARL